MMSGIDHLNKCTSSEKSSFSIDSISLWIAENDNASNTEAKGAMAHFRLSMEILYHTATNKIGAFNKNENIKSRKSS